MYKAGDTVEMSGLYNYTAPFIGKYRVVAVEADALRLKLIEIRLPDGATLPASNEFTQIDNIRVPSSHFDEPLKERLHRMQDGISALLKQVLQT
ncbi:MAG TPA: hypothetical protein PLQ89_08960 [Phycisphaerae bacterium]|nr:hypothetical protein [Phycisphaerae bacterium]